uniref:Uncharacterized protein n=1 Tax=Brugia malayi TaxID=6279 RepID=A8NJX3_BRUMA
MKLGFPDGWMDGRTDGRKEGNISKGSVKDVQDLMMEELMKCTEGKWIGVA